MILSVLNAYVLCYNHLILTFDIDKVIVCFDCERSLSRYYVQWK